MTDRESVTRRVWLGALGATLGAASGCGSRTDTGRGEKTTLATTQTGAPTDTTVPTTETETTEQTGTPDTETPTQDTETETQDTETDTPTPALNQTDYEVARLLGVEDDRTRGIFQGPLFDSYDNDVRVQLLTSREEWQTARREIEHAVGTSYEGLPFVTETAFNVETLVAVWVDMTNRDRVRLVEATRERPRTVRLRVKAVGTFGAQVRLGRILLVRIPNGQRLTRAVVEYLDDDRELTVVTDEKEDASATETTRSRTRVLGDY